MEFFVELTMFTAAGMIPTLFIWVPLYYLSRKIKPDMEYSMVINIGLIIWLTAGLITIIVMPSLFIFFIVMAVSMIIWSVIWYYLKEKRMGEVEEFGVDDYLLLSKSLMTVAFIMILGLNYYCLVENLSGHADFRIINVVFLFAAVGVMELLLVLKVRFKKIAVVKRTSVLTLVFCLFGMLDLLLLIELGIAPMHYVDWIRMHH